jgi:hypothetical protein
MPTATIADGMPPAHPSSSRDTRTFNDPATVAALKDAYTGVTRRRFATSEMISTAAALIPAMPDPHRAARTFSTCDDDRLWREGSDFQVQQSGQMDEGPQWFISVSPGRVRVWTRDEARNEHRSIREIEQQATSADAQATFLLDGDEVPEPIPSREITTWSAKSRANMRASFADLEFAPMFEDWNRSACMVTFTYPRCWLSVAPTGREVKKHMKKWRKRYERAFGPIQCIWKLEFQNRHPEQRCSSCETCQADDDGNAPHIHMLLCVPNVDRAGKPVDFKKWLSESWAEAVDHPDPKQKADHLGAGTNVNYKEGRRAADPRRVITYFAKHSGAEGKEYQHCVPQAWREPGCGPGRFWGSWGLTKFVVTVPVSPAIGTEAGRVLRRHSRAQQVTRRTIRRRYKGGRADSKYPEVIGLAGKQLLQSHTMGQRPCRTRAVRAVNGRGWTLVNDGADMGAQLGLSLGKVVEHRNAERDSSVYRHVRRADTPLVRAYRLPPSPRRDALVARLQGRAVPSSAERSTHT